jgi:hypothetical protein
VCCSNRCHVKAFGLLAWLSLAVKGLWALWDNTYDVCVVTTVTMVMLSRDSGPYGIIFMTTLEIFPTFLMGNLLVIFYCDDAACSNPRSNSF